MAEGQYKQSGLGQSPGLHQQHHVAAAVVCSSLVVSLSVTL